MNWAIMKLYCGESGGAGYYNSQELGLARALKKNADIQITIVYPDRSIKVEKEEQIEEGITILKVPCKTIGVHAFYNLSFLKKKKIDIVQINSDNQMAVPRVIRWCRSNHIFCYNYIGTVYSDTENPFKKTLMDLISKRNIRYCKRVPAFAKTEAVRIALEKEGVQGTKVIPVGLDMSMIRRSTEEKARLRRDLGLPENRKLLLFVGRLEEYKRPFSALELLERLGGAYSLVVIGTGSLLHPFQEMAADKHLEGRVFHFKKIPNVEMYRYYAACDYFVNFNTHEIFGMSILEAMYQGCIVIARRAPGPEQIIEDRVSGFLCQSDRDMDKIIVEISETEHIGEQAHKRIRECFTWDAAAEQLKTEVSKMYIEFKENRK